MGAVASGRPYSRLPPKVAGVPSCAPRRGSHRGAIQWDEAEREENLGKHGIDFVGVETLFEGFMATIEDDRLDYGEQRFVTFGVMEGRVVAVVHTERSDTIRIISIRKATKREEQSYFSTISE